jgi:hypothetical protein
VYLHPFYRYIPVLYALVDIALDDDPAVPFSIVLPDLPRTDQREFFVPAPALVLRLPRVF